MLESRYENKVASLPNGETICYFEIGCQFKDTNPTVLLVHGNLSSKQWWYDIMHLLEGHSHHVIAIDQRGFGQSSYVQHCSCFGDWANDLISFCSVLKISKCMAVGWSFGGAVIMKMAELAPQLVVKVVPTCSVACQGFLIQSDGPKSRTREEIRENKRYQFMNGLLQTKNYESMDQIWGSILFNVAKEYPAEKRKILMMGSFQQRNYLDLLYALANSDINIKAIKSAGLVIHGKQDLVIPVESLTNTIAHFGHSIIRQNNAHMLPIEDPEWFCETLVSFLAQP